MSNLNLCDRVLAGTHQRINPGIFSSPEPLGSQGELIGWP